MRRRGGRGQGWWGGQDLVGHWVAGHPHDARRQS